MKKLIAILSLATVVFMCFFGCSSKEEIQTTAKLTTTTTTQPATVKTTAKPKYKIDFKSLPDIEKYNDFQNKYFYEDGALDEYVPNKDYGGVVPYIVVSKIEYVDKDNKRTNEYNESRVCGFASVDGKIITEPVYKYLQKHTYNSKIVYSFSHINESAPDINEVLSADGLWTHTDIRHISDGVFITNNSDVYDFDNKYICSFGNYDEGIYDLFYDGKNVFIHGVDHKASCYNIKSESYIDIPYFDDIYLLEDFYILRNNKNTTMYNKEMKKCSSEKYAELLKCSDISYDSISKIFLGYYAGKILFFKADGTKINRNHTFPFKIPDNKSVLLTTVHGKNNTSVIVKDLSSNLNNVACDWIDIKTGKRMIDNPYIFKNKAMFFVSEKYIIFYGFNVNSAYVYSTSGKLIKKIDIYPFDTSMYGDVNYHYDSIDVSFEVTNLNTSFAAFDSHNKNILNIYYDDFKKAKSVNLGEFKCVVDQVSLCDNNITMADITLYDIEDHPANNNRLLYFINTEKIYIISPYTFDKFTVNGKDRYTFTTSDYNYLTDGDGNILIKSEANMVL